MALNSVNITGRVTKDPEMRSVGDNIAVCQFTVAVDKKGKGKGTNFIDCVAWKGLAETIQKYVKKGTAVGISGHLDQSSWEKDGKKFSKLQVVADDFAFLESKKSESNSDGLTKIFGEAEKPEEIPLDSIPF